MKVLLVLFMVLLTSVVACAQSIDQKPSTSENLNTIHQNIGQLNKVAFDIYLENPDSARGLAEKALLLSRQVKYTMGTAVSFLNMGHIYWSQSYYPMALFCVNKAMADLPKNKPLLTADCYTLAGRVYADLGNYKEAINNLAQAEYFAGEDPGRLAEVFSEASYVFKRLKNYDEAITNAKKALGLNRIAKNQGNIAVLYGRLTSIYANKRDFKLALAYSDTALSMSVSTHNNRLRATTYNDYARIYDQLHDHNKAVLYASKGAALADSIGVVDALSSAYKVLIGTYEQQNDLKKAMFYQNKYNSIRDSLSAFNKVKNTELIQDYFALNNKLNEMAEIERVALANKAEIKSQKTIIATLALSLVIVMIGLWVTYHFYQQKKFLSDKLNERNEALQQQKQLIEAQTANLETLSKIKDKLLAVIAHDLRTPLANLRNIADMFDTDYLSKEEVHWLMKDINPTVKSAELTLSNLLEWAGNQIRGRSVNSSRLDIFLLGVEMEQVFNYSLQKKSIGFINQASPGQSVMADENHIKVVLRNLISNAIKFTDTNGRILLDSRYEENAAVISVEDTGKGMSSEEMDRLFITQTHFSQPGTLGENGIGIGLMLCKELIELNGGKLWIESAPGEGSKFFFSLPLNKEYA